MRHAYSLWGCQVSLCFRGEVAAYRERWAELEASDNPFATVVMAHLHSQATRRRPGQRLEGELQLVRRYTSAAMPAMMCSSCFGFWTGC